MKIQEYLPCHEYLPCIFFIVGEGEKGAQENLCATRNLQALMQGPSSGERNDPG